MASSTAASSPPPTLTAVDAAAGRPTGTSPLIGYAAGLALVAAATIIAFVVDHLVQTPNLSLVFVLPVIVAALSFGWGPALVSAVISVAVFDFLFVEPRMSFQVASPTDLWALALLLLVAAIASTVGAQSRRRAVEARRAANQAEAGHDLVQTAARSLHRIFDAPAVILSEKAGKLSTAASSGGAHLSTADHEAAQWTLANHQASRAETYPFDLALFDFWPVASRGLVLGVKFAESPDGRPVAPERLVDLVAGYLAGAPASGRAP